MIATYFWKDDEIVTVLKPLNSSSKEVIRKCPCLDAYQTEADMRYGYFDDYGWKPMFYKDFPPKFKLNLLLLGIS